MYSTTTTVLRAPYSTTRVVYYASVKTLVVRLSTCHPCFPAGDGFRFARATATCIMEPLSVELSLAVSALNRSSCAIGHPKFPFLISSTFHMQCYTLTTKSCMGKICPQTGTAIRKTCGDVDTAGWQILSGWWRLVVKMSVFNVTRGHEWAFQNSGWSDLRPSTINTDGI